MSICVSLRRSKLLVQVAAVSMVAVFGASCSSDFSRLDDQFTTASLPTANQRSIIKKTPVVEQPYPGDVDPLTTASTGTVRTAVDRSGVVRKPVSSAAQPYPGDAVNRGPLPGSNVGSVTSIKQTSRLKPVSLLPGNTAEGRNETVRPTSPVANLQPTKDIGKAGWTAIGGTRVSLRQGENLYNLSKRYGVPAKEIMKVNNLSSASNVVPGQKILIPTYTYSRAAVISAPDNHPQTRASRSSMGYEGEVATQSVTVPTWRPSYSGVTGQSTASTTVAGMKRKGIHTVVAGDTLGGIAQRYGVGKDEIIQANGMNTSVVRLGQKLKIPSFGSPANTRLASLKSKKDKYGVDPIVTGSPTSVARKKPRIIKGAGAPVAYTPPSQAAEFAKRASVKAATPKQTGVSSFRWPAKGRVVSKFGARVNGSANDGIDISVPIGTAVKAAENGTVIYSGSELEEFGKLILVRHSGGWVSAYAYSSKNLVKRGDRVKRGQTIARSGRSGTARTPKIHFELRKNSSPVNPLKHLG